MIIDPIADMITRIRNAQAVRKSAVRLPFSKIKFSVAQILLNEGLISEVKQEGEPPHAELVLGLKYDADGKSIITALKRVSTPGRRVYAKKDELPKVLHDLGLAIISTSQGLMTNKEARRKKLGGEVLFEVY